MKKQIAAGIVAGAVVALLSMPLAASAAPRASVPNPHGVTNGEVVNPFKGNELTNPFTGNETTNPHGRTN